jgi:hypothetical protein
VALDQTDAYRRAGIYVAREWAARARFSKHRSSAQRGLSQVATLIMLICNPASLIFAEQLGR